MAASLDSKGTKGSVVPDALVAVAALDGSSSPAMRTASSTASSTRSSTARDKHTRA
eukprot:CAMPEP_0198540092 /NCGR_PEP_ID=MMETSP1462-20131121/51614_1 /TAXON_ID=1333877 /ORGANISM="Brandtodinium nutriculum, Strain RCC3387" /LENGTH=55 /DNA_ID=CAMNT_0044270177 /DNA_START=38 /DNA_END=202 /DNA_ORIENTATION=+